MLGNYIFGINLLAFLQSIHIILHCKNYLGHFKLILKITKMANQFFIDEIEFMNF